MAAAAGGGGGEALRSYDVFWGEMAACDHVVQIYEHDDGMLQALEGFVAGGLETGSAIVIATPGHRDALDARLRKRGIDVGSARAEDRYIALDAERTLGQFMVHGWPDEDRFRDLVGDLISRARGPGRTVRAFGEMVALLWASGHQAATVRLEHLWNQLCDRRQFSLFCSYPKTGFTQDAARSISDICCLHSRVVPDAGVS